MTCAATVHAAQARAAEHHEVHETATIKPVPGSRKQYRRLAAQPDLTARDAPHNGRDGSGRRRSRSSGVLERIFRDKLGGGLRERAQLITWRQIVSNWACQRGCPPAGPATTRARLLIWRVCLGSAHTDTSRKKVHTADHGPLGVPRGDQRPAADRAVGRHQLEGRLGVDQPVAGRRPPEDRGGGRPGRQAAGRPAARLKESEAIAGRRRSVARVGGSGPPEARRRACGPGRAGSPRRQVALRTLDLAGPSPGSPPNAT